MASIEYKGHIIDFRTVTFDPRSIVVVSIDGEDRLMRWSEKTAELAAKELIDQG